MKQLKLKQWAKRRISQIVIIYFRNFKLLGTLLGNLLTSKWAISRSQGQGTIRAGEETNRAGEGTFRASQHF